MFNFILVPSNMFCEARFHSYFSDCYYRHLNVAGIRSTYKSSTSTKLLHGPMWYVRVLKFGFVSSFRLFVCFRSCSVRRSLALASSGYDDMNDVHKPHAGAIESMTPYLMALLVVL